MTGQSNPFGKPVDEEDDDLLHAVSEEDLDKADSKFKVPDGVHEAHFVSVKRETSKKGNPMLTAMVTLTGEYKTDKGFRTLEDDTKGKEFKTWIPLGASALFKQKEVQEALDIPVVDKQIQFRKSNMVGKQLLVVMETREYEGRESSSVKSMMRHPDGPEIDEVG